MDELALSFSLACLLPKNRVSLSPAQPLSFQHLKAPATLTCEDKKQQSLGQPHGTVSSPLLSDHRCLVPFRHLNPSSEVNAANLPESLSSFLLTSSYVCGYFSILHIKRKEVSFFAMVQCVLQGVPRLVHVGKKMGPGLVRFARQYMWEPRSRRSQEEPRH